MLQFIETALWSWSITQLTDIACSNFTYVIGVVGSFLTPVNINIHDFLAYDAFSH